MTNKPTPYVTLGELRQQTAGLPDETPIHLSTSRGASRRKRENEPELPSADLYYRAVDVTTQSHPSGRRWVQVTLKPYVSMERRLGL